MTKRVLVNIVVVVIGNSGSDATFRTDYWAFSDGSLSKPIIDDFEDGVAPGTSCVGIPLGFCTFQDASSSVSIVAATTTPAPLLPEFGMPNTVMQVELDVAAFAGFLHGSACPPDSENGDSSRFIFMQFPSSFLGFVFHLLFRELCIIILCDYILHRASLSIAHTSAPFVSVG